MIVVPSTDRMLEPRHERGADQERGRLDRDGPAYPGEGAEDVVDRLHRPEEPVGARARVLDDENPQPVYSSRRTYFNSRISRRTLEARLRLARDFRELRDELAHRLSHGASRHGFFRDDYEERLRSDLRGDHLVIAALDRHGFRRRSSEGLGGRVDRGKNSSPHAAHAIESA